MLLAVICLVGLKRDGIKDFDYKKSEQEMETLFRTKDVVKANNYCAQFIKEVVEGDVSWLPKLMQDMPLELQIDVLVGGRIIMFIGGETQDHTYWMVGQY